MSLRVAVHIADERAQRHLTSILSLAAQRAQPIELVKVTDRGIHAPQVIVVGEADPDAEQLIQAAKIPGAPRVIVYGASQRDYPWVLASPATSESLHRLMQQVVLAPVARSNIQAANSDSASLPVQAFSIQLKPLQPCDFLLAIAQARLENRVLEIQPDGVTSAIYIDGANDRVYATDAFDLLDQRTYADLFAMKGLRFSGLPQLPRSATSLNSCSLEAVIWSLAYAQPLTKISSAALRVRFGLRRWPYFSEFRYGADQLAWAAQLVRAPASLAALVEHNAKLTDTAVRFYNACVYSGIALAAPQDVASDDITHESTGRWRNLLAKVRGN